MDKISLCLSTFLDPVGSSDLAAHPHPSQLPSSSARETGFALKSQTQPLCLLTLMICICRLETGKQYIVCANSLSFTRFLSLYTFYLYRICAV